MRGKFMMIVLIAALVLISTQSAYAQGPAARHEFGVGGGLMNFDLSGTGNSWVIVARGTRALSDRVAIEGGVSIARPDQQFGTTTFIAPEVHVQYFWALGRFRPYGGGGIGFAYEKSDLLDSETKLTLSAAGGAKIELSPVTAVFGEMRLRGVEHDFVGSTAEWVGGFAWSP
jgi:hypothetical protein